MPDPRPKEDPDAPVTEQERAAAEELRAALDDPGRPSDDAALARALASAWSPRDLPAEEHRALVEKAIARPRPGRRRTRVVGVAFGAMAGALALAAGAMLVLRGDGRSRVEASVVVNVALSRSTQPLFQAPFAPVGGETTRIDRIAMARAADLRENEFARWGVR